MKKWFLILILSFIVTGCSDNDQNTLSSSCDVVETPRDTQTDSTNDSIKAEPEHEYFCDKFLLTVDNKQIDLTTIDPELSSISELYPIADDQLYILGRVDENYNSLMIYDFNKEEIIFSEHGTTMCWVQGKFETLHYLKDNAVYDFDGNVIYQPDTGRLISMIEYVVEDFLITVTDSNYENLEEIWIT